MTLYVFDSSFNPLGIIDDVISMTWTRKFRDIGTMALEVPFTDAYNSFLQLGRYITKEGRSGEVRMISYKSFNKKEDGQEVIDIQGVDPLDILSRRVIPEDYTCSGTPCDVCNLLASKAVGSSAGSNRYISNIVISHDSDISGSESEDYSFEAGTNVRDAITSVLQEHDAGVETTVDKGTIYINFLPYIDKGKSSVHPIVFSSDWGTLGDQTYTESTLDYYNVIYNWYVYTDSDGVKQRIMFITHDEYTGMNRRETIGKEYETEDITMAKRMALHDYAVGASEEKTFEGEVGTGGQYVYRTDYDLGYKVIIINKKWDVAVEETITEIEETYDAGSENIKVTFGDNTITLYQKLVRTMRRALL